MKKGIILLFGSGLILFSILKAKKKAWDKVEIIFKKFSIQGFDLLDLKCVLTISLKNPTDTALKFDNIEGTVTDEKQNKLGTFNNDIGADIKANATTDVDIKVNISLSQLTKSIIDLIANGFKMNVLVDSITTVSGIKIPVRQVFNIDFSMVKNLIDKSDPQQGRESGDFNLDSTVRNETPTVAQPELFTVTDEPNGFIVANGLGDIDPNGGVVITLPPPVGDWAVNPDGMLNVPNGSGGTVMVLGPNIPTYTFNTSTGLTIGKRNNRK